MASKVSDVEPGQRQLNGTQTTGRDYKDLSTPEYGMTHDFDVKAPMRDGINLMADVYRPDTDGKFPVLIAASPYPRQIQDLRDVAARGGRGAAAPSPGDLPAGRYRRSVRGDHAGPAKARTSRRSPGTTTGSRRSYRAATRRRSSRAR